MWETILTMAIPSLVTMVATNFFNKKKYLAEVKQTETGNVQSMLAIYGQTLDQYKREIKDVNDRFTDYMQTASDRAELSKRKFKSMEKRLEEKNSKIKELEKKINAMLKDACLVKGCSKRVYLNELDG